MLRCAAVAGAIGLIGLGGCGRRGNLEPPEGSGLSSRQTREPGRIVEGSQTETLEQTRRVGNIVPPKDPFILDPLL